MSINYRSLAIFLLFGISALGGEISLKVLDQMRKDIEAGKKVEYFAPSFRDKELETLKIHLELELGKDEIAYTVETEDHVMLVLGFSGDERLRKSVVKKFLKGEKIAGGLNLSYLRFSMRPEEAERGERGNGSGAGPGSGVGP